MTRCTSGGIPAMVRSVPVSSKVSMIVAYRLGMGLVLGLLVLASAPVLLFLLCPGALLPPCTGRVMPAYLVAGNSGLALEWSACPWPV